MTARVLDSSVAVKWYIEEEDSDAADAILGAGFVFCAPDLIYAEVPNVLWKRAVRMDIPTDQAETGLMKFRAVDVKTTGCNELMDHALSIAFETGRAVYDCFYLALTEVEGAPLITADRRLYMSTRSTRFAPNVIWIREAVPTASNDAT